MSEAFDAYRYIGYLQARWRWVAASALLAAGLAGAASMAMTPQYTATARVVIDPPAGADLRAAMAVSPIYLESLKTYEEFASCWHPQASLCAGGGLNLSDALKFAAS